MIKIINKQRKITLDSKEVKKDVQRMLIILGYQDFDIAIWFTTNATICKYNKKYLNKDMPTDILSFPFHENLKPGQKIVAVSDDDRNLGDIIISLEYAQSKTLEFKIEFKKHIKKTMILWK